ncbi:MAG: hypothetical protein QME73_06390 [Bacillota bacterium]|nr:hypothetical protein [Bacillota bacterium]
MKITIADLLLKCNYQLGKLLDDSLSDEQMNMNLPNDTIAKSVKWVSQGGEADEMEGVDLFIKASRILLDASLYNYKSGRADKIDSEYESIYCIKNEGINIDKNILKDKLQNCKEASQNTVSSLLGADDFINSKDGIALICDKPDWSIWPILCGFGAAGFTVVAELPLPIKINRRFLAIINELLNSSSGGRIIELSNNQ